MLEPRNMFPEGTPIRRVIDFATTEFFTKGVKQVTMDDIAKGLQMSKRTLYQLFADKEQLIIACIEVLTESEHMLAQTLINQKHNVLEIILRIIEHRLKRLGIVSIEYVTEVKRYNAVREYVKIAQEESINRAEKIYKIGIDQGLFRDDVNIKLLMECLYLRMNDNYSPTVINKYSIEDCFINIGLFHLRGCCTPLGIELIDKFLERYRNNEQQETQN